MTDPGPKAAATDPREPDRRASDRAAPPPGGADPAAAFALFNDIGIVAQLATARLARVLTDGLHPSHFTVLNHFARRGGAQSPADLARAFQVSKATMTHTLQKLEAAGFVALRPDPTDGRMKRVTLTEAGRAARDRAIAALGPELAMLAAQVGPEALAALAPAMRTLRETLDRARDAEAHGGGPGD